MQTLHNNWVKAIAVGACMIVATTGYAQEDSTTVVRDEHVFISEGENGEDDVQVIIQTDDKDESRVVIKSEGDSWSVVMDGEEVSIDELIERAFEHNPELRFAEADIERAVSKLHRVRADVVRDITRLHSDLMRTQREITRKRAELKARGEDIDEDSLVVEYDFGEQVADLKTLIHEISLTVGSEIGDALEGIDWEIERAMPAFPPMPTPPQRPTLSDEQADALEVKVDSIQFEGENVGNILGFLGEEYQKNFVIDPSVNMEQIGSMSMQDVTLRTALLAISDSVPGLVFVFRDYGILATTEDRAARINAPTIPDDAPYETRGGIFGSRAPRASRILVER